MLVCELERAGSAVSEGGLVEALEAGESILRPCSTSKLAEALELR